MFVVVETRIEARLMLLETRASCFDTSIDTHNRFTTKPCGPHHLNLYTHERLQGVF